jgi:hypothetical protein
LLERSKCSFAQQSLEYLGHIIGAEEVSTELTKVQAVADWPTPFDVKQLGDSLDYQDILQNSSGTMLYSANLSLIC